MTDQPFNDPLAIINGEWKPAAAKVYPEYPLKF